MCVKFMRPSETTPWMKKKRKKRLRRCVILRTLLALQSWPTASSSTQTWRMEWSPLKPKKGNMKTKHYLKTEIKCKRCLTWINNVSVFIYVYILRHVPYIDSLFSLNYIASKNISLCHKDSSLLCQNKSGRQHWRMATESYAHGNFSLYKTTRARHRGRDRTMAMPPECYDHSIILDKG